VCLDSVTIMIKLTIYYILFFSFWNIHFLTLITINYTIFHRESKRRNNSETHRHTSKEKQLS
jgi:hypothetical protein